ERRRGHDDSIYLPDAELALEAFDVLQAPGVLARPALEEEHMHEPEAGQDAHADGEDGVVAHATDSRASLRFAYAPASTCPALPPLPAHDVTTAGSKDSGTMRSNPWPVSQSSCRRSRTPSSHHSPRSQRISSCTCRRIRATSTGTSRRARSMARRTTSAAEPCTFEFTAWRSAFAIVFQSAEPMPAS